MDDQVLNIGNHSLFAIPQVFPVVVTITAWAVKKEDGHERRRKIRQNTKVVGHMLKEKILAKKEVKPSVTPKDTGAAAEPLDLDFGEPIDHPHADLMVADYHMTMKLPNIVPIDYSSCEVMIGAHWLCHKDDFLKSVKRMRPVIGTAVQEDLMDIARDLGGEIPFVTEGTPDLS